VLRGSSRSISSLVTSLAAASISNDVPGRNIWFISFLKDGIASLCDRSRRNAFASTLDPSSFMYLRKANTIRSGSIGRRRVRQCPVEIEKVAGLVSLEQRPHLGPEHFVDVVGLEIDDSKSGVKRDGHDFVDRFVLGAVYFLCVPKIRFGVGAASGRRKLAS
jgi:hypothetical protein